MFLNFVKPIGKPLRFPRIKQALPLILLSFLLRFLARRDSSQPIR